MVAGDLRLEPAVCPVRRDRGGVRPATIDRAPPAAAGDPEAVCGKMSCDRLDPAMSLIPLGASRSDHLLTPQTRQRSNGSANPGQKFPSTKKYRKFSMLEADQGGWCAGEGRKQTEVQS